MTTYPLEIIKLIIIFEGLAIAVTHSKDKEELAYKLGANSVVSDGDMLLKA
jgi:D-arabinose 1-dehydrogenase-like Zn-dependent alcohol dehydrogenase